jgi:hypothetical protein
MVRPLLTIGFFISEVVLLIIFLAIAGLLSAAISTDVNVGYASLWSWSEIRSATGAAMMFLILSGYIISIAILSVIFYSRLLTVTHALWTTLLFVLHAAFFFFYLQGPAVLSSAFILIAVGTVSVGGAAVMEYFLWRKWLPIPG